ncbi:MAG: zinc-ribbon domain-containing protein [Oscillatoriales cyanobacterium RU_3_3]|nr:zinc-ribbon domain-containing protein [Oscillatoriales cyanobacterium RU_3_3]
MNTCPSCDTPVLPDDRFCEACGTPLTTTHSPPSIRGSTATCAKCGSAELDAAGYCIQCGFRNLDRGSNERIEIARSPVFAGVSDPGVRYSYNQDFVALQTLDSTHILVVCDGVSSSHAPDRASQIVAETIVQQITEQLQYASAETAIRVAMQAAFRAVSKLPYPADTEPPSTTFVGAIVRGKTATIAWLGDSRAYWISPQKGRQLTQDHSWLNEVVSLGKMSEAEAKSTGNAHAITRWVGKDASDDAEPAIVQFEMPDRGYLLLCSDGLWNYAATAEQLMDLVRPIETKDAMEISLKLVDYARSRGGHDNITVALLQIE